MIREPAVMVGVPASAVSERSRSIRSFDANRPLVLMVSDLAMFVTASVIATWYISWIYHPLVYKHVLESALIWTAFSAWTFARLGLYRISYALDDKDELYYVTAGLAIGTAPLLLLFSIIPSLSSSRVELVTGCGLAVLLVGSSRSMIHRRFEKLSACSRRRIALVAKTEDLLRISAAMDSPATSLRLIPMPGVEEAIAQALEGSGLSWYERLRAEGCDEIVFAGLPPTRTALMVERAARDHISIGFAPSGLSSPYRLDLSQAMNQPILLASRPAACTPVNRLLKRLFDLGVASIGLVVTLPLIALAALALVLESGRPVLFRQTRVGRDGEPFEIYKLRTMVQDAEAVCGPVWAADPVTDRRTTKVGAFLRKTSIDELPQLINVLRGDMSIVGPRPERPVFVEQFRKQYVRYDERHLVRPGITGWSQIHMRRFPDIALVGEKVDLDLFYIENYSLFLDVSLVIKTAVEVLFRR
ncbi:MAG: sugar transferase [Candidatus Cybelea sp.]